MTNRVSEICTKAVERATWQPNRAAERESPIILGFCLALGIVALISWKAMLLLTGFGIVFGCGFAWIGARVHDRRMLRKRLAEVIKYPTVYQTTQSLLDQHFPKE